MKTLNLLIDAEMLVYAALASAETETNWGEDIWTLHVNLDEAKAKFTDKLDYIIERVCTKYQAEAEDDIRYRLFFCLSDKENFRKKVLPTYKLHRAGKRKPVGYAALLDWLVDTFTTKCRSTLEADDVIGIMATHPEPIGIPIIVSGDKDLKSIPGYHYNFLRDDFFFVTEKEADRNFYTQALTGDKTDGYDGCPGVGPKTAERLLGDGPSWERVINAYKAHGLTEADALREARLARILRYKDYDHEKGEVILWTPPEDPSPKANLTPS